VSECPVCYTPLIQDHIGYAEYALSEEQTHCPNGCYDYQFSYGSSEVFITIRGHHINFGWSYLDNDSRPRDKALDIVLMAARRALVEDLLAKVKSEDSKAIS
jgi:hypothetical protein